MNISRYSKAIAALLGALAAAVADNILDLNDVATLIAAVLPTLVVFFAPANTD